MTVAEPEKRSGAPEAKKPASPPKKSPARPKKAGPGGARRKRARPSPVPVSMWLLPRLRIPFGTPLEFLRWFFTGINFWAVGAVVLCAVAGWGLLERFGQPRQLGVEQALAGGEGTGGLTYTVERTGVLEATVTGSWDPEKGQEEPGPELAAALCAALSPEEIYGHSDHLYRAIAGRFFDGEDFDLVILLKEQEPEKPGEDWSPPEPVFSIRRGAGEEDWPQPECDAAFARRWREAYSGYWVFGQGRKEDLGPPQSDPIIEEGDRPPEEPDSDSEEAPPLPDLDGEGDEPEEGGDGESLPEEASGEEASGSDGGSSAEASEPEALPEPEPEDEDAPGGLERFFRWVLEQAKKHREKGFAERSEASLPSSGQ